MPDKLKESKFKGNEKNKSNRGVSGPKRGGGPGNAAPPNARNSANPDNPGGKNLLKKIKSGNAFKSGKSSTP